MDLCNCERPKNSIWNKKPVCRSCYKKFWAKSKGKTNTVLKYREEFDRHVETVRNMANTHSIADIEKETGLYHKAIICIANIHNIKLNRKGKTSKTLEREKRFLDLLKSGFSINKAKKEVNFNPKKANELAASLSVFPKTKDNNYRIGLEEAQKKTKPYIRVSKSVKKNKRRCFEVICTRCNHISIKETPYLHTGCCNCEKPTITQNAISDWIKNQELEVIKNTRKIIPPKELDIFIPSLKLGIEYCGLYWHSEDAGKNRSYHYSKLKDANKEGIRLITIFEDEWISRQDQVKNFLLSIMNKNEHKIFGRKTVVKTIEKDIANNFYDQNHIQGRPGLSILHLGLFTTEGDKLVGCMSFGPHHRGGKNTECILNRLAFLHNHTVYGGASKLLSYAISALKLRGFSKIISWSDNRWSEGNVYNKLGFKLDQELGPDYSYVTARGTRVSKQSCQKKHLLKKGAVGDTELEMAKSLGYSRIWDCGKKRWIYDLES